MDPQQPGPSKEATISTDWKKCILCQKVTTESLRCPAESIRNDVGVGLGYSTLSLNLVRFNELHEMPIPIDLNRLDDGNGLEPTLQEHKAKWHKSCYLKFNTTKLQRAEKRKSAVKGSDDDSTTSKKYTRQSITNKVPTADVCFFL